MNNLKIFCLSIYNDNYNFFKKMGFIPVGLGDNLYNSNWLLDNTKKKYFLQK